MSFYANSILPHLIRHTMRGGRFAPYRRRVVGAALGRVLEVGIGSGENLPYYGAGVTELIGLEPSARLAAMTRRAAAGAAFDVHVIEASAERMPLDNHGVDTVVLTWTLCSIPDAPAALREIRRVLQREGRLLFVEHGRSPERGVGKLQDVLTPFWRRVAGGCHLNRSIDRLIAEAGFALEHLETGYMAGPRLLTYLYEGRARPTGSGR
jgi:ubiquinone/menaquinone biosynthesis C-methylase UbiE